MTAALRASNPAPLEVADDANPDTLVVASRSGRPRTTTLRVFNPAVLEDVDANPAVLVV
jgi:hypothetical protein